jgi:predicted RNA binding protein YcfA (HicA-like mRNA interferase family)
MSEWPAAKARKVLAALISIGWHVKRQSGSHKTLARDDYPDYVFAFHDNDEIGPVMLARIANHTGLNPRDLKYHHTPIASSPTRRSRKASSR